MLIIHNNPILWSGILIVIIIFCIGSYVNMYWPRENNTSYISGAHILQDGLNDDNISILGTTETQNLCEQKCKESTWCQGYSWYDDFSIHAKKCYGLKNIGKRMPQKGVYSGARPVVYCHKTSRGRCI